MPWHRVIDERSVILDRGGLRTLRAPRQAFKGIVLDPVGNEWGVGVQAVEEAVRAGRRPAA